MCKSCATCIRLSRVTSYTLQADFVCVAIVFRTTLKCNESVTGKLVTCDIAKRLAGYNKNAARIPDGVVCGVRKIISFFFPYDLYNDS